MSLLSKPYFHDEQASYDYLENVIWANGINSLHCGSMGKGYALKGETTRIGLKKCGVCRKQFTVKVGTVFESSHVLCINGFRLSISFPVARKEGTPASLHPAAVISN